MKTEIKMNDGRTTYTVKESVDDIQDYVLLSGNLDHKFAKLTDIFDRKILINIDNVLAISEADY
ncbi:hypothetical protein [Lactobacillus bombicola]|uniref:hypothetical protein n=1 Tax=Lactobacillus bombicola TaxID=1505723 RepID=UPI000E596136|nr:hypothetical protein [Lactobacillus bombicola]RHW48981.1 hypothetical protein DS833_05595 [Lactobacillus bombicola]